MTDVPGWEDRWCITGQLVLRSPLALGSGRRGPRAAGGEGTLALVERDVRGRPYLPGTSLKGVVRDWCCRALPGPAHLDLLLDLFGDLPVQLPGQEEQQPLGGRLEFEDAFLDGEQAACAEFASTAIDGASGASKRRQLRAQERVPVGTAFRLRIEAEGLAPEDARLVVLALRAFARDEITLGADGATGLGRAEVRDIAVHRLTADALQHWLRAADPGQSLHWFGEEHRVDLAALPALQATAPRADLWLHLTLGFDGPFLVAEPRPNAPQGESKVRPVRAGYGEPFLPGSSVRGVCRAQAVRIANTIATAAARAAVVRLFGPEAEAHLHLGALTFEDFQLVEPVAEKAEEHVALDRFTGGSADKLKFQLLVQPSPTYTGRIGLRLRAPRHEPASGKPEGARKAEDLDLKPGDLALLVLLLRDLAERDLAFGAATTRGMGALRSVSAELEAPDDTDDRLAAWLRDWGQAAPAALHRGPVGDARTTFAPWHPVVTAALTHLRAEPEGTDDGG